MASSSSWIPLLEGRSNYRIWNPLMKKRLISLGFKRCIHKPDADAAVAAKAPRSSESPVSLPSSLTPWLNRHRDLDNYVGTWHDKDDDDETLEKEADGNAAEEVAQRLANEEQDDAQAFLAICSKLGPNLSHHILSNHSARDLWEDLDDWYGFKYIEERSTIRRELKAIHLSNFESETEFAIAFRQVVSKFELSGEPQSADAIRTYFLNAVSGVYPLAYSRLDEFAKDHNAAITVRSMTTLLHLGLLGPSKRETLLMKVADSPRKTPARQAERRGQRLFERQAAPRGLQSSTLGAGRKMSSLSLAEPAVVFAAESRNFAEEIGSPKSPIRQHRRNQSNNAENKLGNVAESSMVLAGDNTVDASIRMVEKTPVRSPNRRHNRARSGTTGRKLANITELGSIFVPETAVNVGMPAETPTSRQQQHTRARSGTGGRSRSKKGLWGCGTPGQKLGHQGTASPIS